MQWPPMTIDENAALQKDNGAKLSRAGTSWWISAGPLFFRPLFPFLKMAPDRRAYPAASFWGGIQHLVTDTAKANSSMRFFVYDDLQNYDLSILERKHRSHTRNSLKRFTARRIIEQSDFVNQAHPIYLDFYQRTRYSYKKKRVEKQAFEQWARTLFAHPKLAITGAYHNDTLAAVEISYRIADVIIGASFFSDTASQKLRVKDFMLHTLRESAATTDATYYYVGAPTNNNNLDESKRRSGCRLLKLPACYCANPVSLNLIRLFHKERYRKLIGT